MSGGLRLSEAAVAAGGVLRGADAEFDSVSIDSRTLRAGDVYVAIKGERHDGHAFIDDAAARGAAAAVVNAPRDIALPQIVVSDTRLALGQLAAAWRARFTVPVVGVTGSNGKTTVKEMLAAILRQRGEVLVTQGNLNNDYGVPLTLFRLRADHRYAVIEMGANHLGEIAYVAGLARPTAALITNAGAAHLEGFGSLDGVARGKGEIYAALAADGVAVLNADDAYADYWRGVIGRRPVISFGYAHAEVTVVDGTERMMDGAHPGLAFTLRTPRGEAPVHLQLLGRHNVINACAAAAAALAVGADMGDIQAGLAAMRPVKGRLQWRRLNQRVSVIDDTYNANPSSVRAALRVLVELPGRHLFVMGDLGELGEGAEELHANLGGVARAAGVAELYTAGVLSGRTAAAFGAGAHHFSTQAELIDALRKRLTKGDEPITLLVKGSRRAQMEKVVEALTGAADQSNARQPGEG